MKLWTLLLTLCGILEAAISIDFLLQGTHFLGTLTLAPAYCGRSPVEAGCWC